MESKYLSESEAWLIEIAGDLDLYSVPELRKEVKSCITEKKSDFIIDCSNMSFIDSTGLGELAGLMKEVSKYDGKISINGLKPHIKKVFFITGLNTIFDISGDEDE